MSSRPKARSWVGLASAIGGNWVALIVGIFAPKLRAGRSDFTLGQFGENFTVDGLPTTRYASVTSIASAERSSR